MYVNANCLTSALCLQHIYIYIYIYYYYYFIIYFPRAFLPVTFFSAVHLHKKPKNITCTFWWDNEQAKSMI